MAKKRTIPFGYRMENGKITAHPGEVLTVLSVFSDYLAGKSMNQIAAQMDVPYDDGVRWNKNKIHRILGNKTYLGTDKYPQLISEEVFQAVQEAKPARAKAIRLIPEDMQEIADMVFCKECGHRLFRCARKQPHWDCRREECCSFLFTLTDQMLTGAILNVLNTVIANPALLETDSTITTYTPTSDIIRQQNEINHMMDSPQIDYDRIQAKIYKLAAMKYDCCQYSDAPQKTERLKSLLYGRKQMKTLDTSLLQSCVKRILVSHCCTIEVEFINGIIIQNITERKDGT